MKLLTVHADFLEYEALTKATTSAEEAKKGKIRVEECLVAFCAVEEGDKDVKGTAASAAKEMMSIAEQVKCKRIVIYPWVHLTQNPSSLGVALSVLKETEKEFSSDASLEISRAPFGWYKSFDIKCKGHPLSELSRSISAGGEKKGKAEEPQISASLKAEDKLAKKYYIMDLEGNLHEPEKFDFSKFQNLKKFANYEMSKVRAYDKEPPHIKLMKEHNISDYEPGSDCGNLRWYPNGTLIKRLLEQSITECCVNYGGMEVETPLMYDFEHPALKKYLNRFPARQYTVLSDDKSYFLRFAACFGQFLM
ncbi:threonine--tRNA ligase, partial [Candidatus Micrarchaeota archaeon CG11_big_fil_rev_8_21_14_0_20_47_5]